MDRNEIFKMSAFAMSFLLAQLECAIAVAAYALGSASGFPLVGETLSLAFVMVALISHFSAAGSSLLILAGNEEAWNSIPEGRSFGRNNAIRGASWRFYREVESFKRTTSFKFLEQGE